MRASAKGSLRVVILTCASVAFSAGLASCRDRGPEVDRNTGLKPETHEPHFPIANGTHAGIDCNACHGDFDTFKGFTCLSAGCHSPADTDPRHGSVGGYHYDSLACLSCHPRGEGDGPGVDHTKYFPIGAGTKHEKSGCAQCHTNPSNRADIGGCASEGCHGQAETMASHTPVGTYEWKGEKCVRCHADAQVDRVAAHKPVRIIGTGHRKCLGCHTQSRMDKPWGADWKPYTCESGCHSRATMDEHHKEIAGYKWDFPTCLSAGCHPDGRKK